MTSSPGNTRADMREEKEILRYGEKQDSWAAGLANSPH